MSEIISNKKLFEEVTGIKVEKIRLIRDGSIIQFETYQTHGVSDYEPVMIENISTYVSCSINIHHYAHKCKEWAAKQYYSVNSGWSMTHWGGTYHVEVIREANKVLFSQSQDSEPEAVFKACQWILDNKENQNEKN
jgi:hypothetical protein